MNTKDKVVEIIRSISIGDKDYSQYVEAIADKVADKWIPVEERLPDPNEYDWVLGAVKTTELLGGRNWYLPPHIVECRNGKWWAMGEDFSLKDLHCEVTHWMPLPEYPKEV